MTAQKFIKLYGWDEAKKFIGWYGGDTSFKFIKVKEKTISVHSGDQPYDFHIDDLKQFVDAWELVEKHGGLDMAKDLSISQVGLSKHYLELKQAIELVESVNERN